MKEVEYILAEFAETHGLAGEDGYFSSASEIIQQSDRVQQELTELVCKIYECFMP